ncbi:hypothetical protein [Streptomyces enissocaesilis]|uniref:hypothetical protein n=1 Tax=Streptomyces enissocaesilis TaxID=332589 RepID=UPI0031D03AD1
MGIESDQLVYDYLSRVGDLAQQHKLPAATRMRLVATLRDEIDRQRSGFGTPDSPAAVRRILNRIGPPADLVAAASGGAMPEPGPAARQAVLPEQRDKPAEGGGRGGRGRWVPRPRGRDHERADAVGAADGPVASPPHLAGSDELGPQGGEPDWWRVEPGPLGMGTTVPGFVGGVEIPEILKPPPAEDEAEADEGEGESGAGGGAGVEAEVPPGRRRLRVRLRRRTAGQGEAVVAAAAVRRPAHVLLLLAAALLVVGAVLGNWLALGGGWLLAYASHRLSRAEAKWVVLGLPGLVVAGAAVWLWGRTEGRWGEPLARDALGEAVSGMWPGVVRTAAVASALHLVWRARRR